ncbi:MAG: hypothetical protein JWR26_2038 [Pedosphaera sp.]|nr:hypothetical protein [Pedosphaera sp.]
MTAPETSTNNTKEPNPVVAYTVEEAAIILRMSTKSVRRQIQRRNLRRCNKFGRIMIPRKDVDSFYEKHSSFAE